MQWMDDTTLPSRGQASRVNAPEDGFGSKSIYDTRPSSPLVPTLQLLGGSSILGWDPVQPPDTLSRGYPSRNE